MDIRVKKRASKGFLILAISSFSLGLGVTASAVVNGVMPENSICSTAYYENNPEIKSSSCINLGTGGRFTPPEDTNPPSEDEANIISTFKCGDAEFSFTQGMKDWSDANVERKNKGEALEPYPNGGWTIAVNINEAMPGSGAEGYALTETGDFNGSYAGLRNDSGWALAMNMGENCGYGKVKDGSLHSETGPAQVMVTNGELSHTWFKNGTAYREDKNLPVKIEYHGATIDSNIKRERWLIEDLPLNKYALEYREYDAEGSTIGMGLAHKVGENMTETKQSKDSIESEEGREMWDYYWNGGEVK